MDMVLTLLNQVIMMFLLVAVGYLMFRSGKISPEGSKTLGNLLIWLSLPCVIINGFLIERTPEHMMGLLYSAAAAAVILALSILISRLAFPRDAIAAFAGAFANPGFFGTPLIIATLGSKAVFYVTPFIAFLNVLQWTYGVSIMTQEGEKKQKKLSELISVGKLLKAPFVIAILIGLFFFLTGLPMPEIAKKCISSISALNTPLAMFTIGVYLADTDIRTMLTKASLYKVAMIRLLLIPAAALAVLSLLPGELQEMKLAIFIVAACPVGSNVAVYAQLHGKNYAYAVETVLISTVLCVVTIPCLAYLAMLLF